MALGGVPPSCSYASLYQNPRTPPQELAFRGGLGVMGNLYASAVGTTVRPPPRTPHTRAGISGRRIVRCDCTRACTARGRRPCTSARVRTLPQVLQYKSIPERPPSFDGLVVLGDVAPSADEAALRAALSRVAAVVRVEVRDDRTAVVTFASHDEATRAVAAGPGALYGWLDTMYNARPYDLRGW